jgi:DNA modification methylase
MTPYYADDWLTVMLGDCRQVMAQMEPESVHCVVTSPPYWGLRDYGQDGQLGLEPTPEAYVESMVAVFREVRRVLRSDGTVWLNLGDSYAAGPTASLGNSIGVGQASQEASLSRPSKLVAGLKPKDLVGIPWRVAFALQADGWVLRSEVIWSKPNPMPESVTDRPTKAHEQMFMFSKGKRIGPEPTKYDDIPEGEARWLAALFDGEGSLVCRREADNGDEYGAHAAQVSIGGTSRALIERLAAVVGEGSVLERTGTNAPMHYWQTSGKRAMGLLRRIYPFLVVKQRQARCLIALEDRKLVRGGHKRLDRAEIEYRDRIWLAVKELNHFGDPDLAGIPEPVFGRWTSQRYYYDADAVREAQHDYGGPDGYAKRIGRKEYHEANSDPKGGGLRGLGGFQTTTPNPAGRNLRSVWTIATQPYPGAHFATFPQALVEPCIKAGTSEKGVCPECGAPWERVVERTNATRRGDGAPSVAARLSGGLAVGSANHMGSPEVETTGWKPPYVAPSEIDRYGTGQAGVHRKVGGQYQKWLDEHPKQTVGWNGPCKHEGDPIPATVLDPFAGSGTTGLVAQRLSRRAVLIDLNGEYLEQVMDRNRDIPLGLGA